MTWFHFFKTLKSFPIHPLKSYVEFYSSSILSIYHLH